MATGTLVPALNIEVGSVLSGQVSKLLVDFNDKVKRGQVLAELDDRSYAFAVDASHAALVGSRFEIKSYEARLKRAILDLWQTEHQLPVFQARVDAARIALETAEREFKRKQWLQEREVAAAADVQNMQSRRDAATSALREAEANLANQSGLVSAARADVDLARAELANARRPLAQRRLTLNGPRSARPSTASWLDATSPRRRRLRPAWKRKRCSS
jgi:HlyD family secretion protein